MSLERVGVLVVSYGSRGCCIAEQLARSDNYDVELFIVDKQRNPANLKLSSESGGVHVVVPDLGVDAITRFVEKHSTRIDFGWVGPEDPIIRGVRDRVEKVTGVRLICPTSQAAVERSKVLQREILGECCPEANPRFKVFDPKDFPDKESVRKAFFRCLEEFGYQMVVKPDRPGFGKGVGVWGDHFNTPGEAFNHFMGIYPVDRVIVEQKLEGEEFSLQFFSDGRSLVATPAVRDYKRAFDWDQGPNTGGMGSYKDKNNLLPFMDGSDWKKAIEYGEKLFNFLKRRFGGESLLGIPLYVAFICTSTGVKILENNSRAGDPEIMNVLPLLRDDFVDLSYKILDGKLTKIGLQSKASVVTYAVPMTYGGYREEYTGDTKIKLGKLEKLREQYGEQMRIYPGSMEIRENGEIHHLKSRTIAILGIADTIKEAREISIAGIRSLDGPLWNREDIGYEAHIERSKRHMEKLRSKT